MFIKYLNIITVFFQLVFIYLFIFNYEPNISKNVLDSSELKESEFLKSLNTIILWLYFLRMIFSPRNIYKLQVYFKHRCGESGTIRCKLD